MQIERSDIFEGLTYIMTETHYYSDVLTLLKELEPRAMPIKHVGTNKLLATGYKIPSDT